jgi:hypothetical protein
MTDPDLAARWGLTLDQAHFELPPGWVVDPHTIDRLSWLLEHAPDHIEGVIAPAGSIRAGASYRTHAEHLSLLPLTAVGESRQRTWRGAVLARPGVAVDVGDGEVTVDISSGSVLVDHGAHVHDPAADGGALRPATGWGRSPFPWRPLVVLVALGTDAPLAWARSLVNDLMGEDVEARLATTTTVAGPHLTRPCLAGAGSIGALRPDVVVAVDDEARAALPPWLAEPAPPVVVLDPDATDAVLTRSARHRDGPWDGRFGRSASAQEVATLCRRLCGPPRRLTAPPVPASSVSSVSPVSSVSLTGGRRSTSPGHRRLRVARRRTIAVAAARLDAAERRRVDGLVGYLRQAGDVVAMADGPVDADTISDADLVLIRGAAVAGALADRIDARARTGSVTVLDLAPIDLSVEPGRDGAGAAIGFTDDAERVMRMVDGVLTASRAVADQLADRSTPHLLVPDVYDPDGWRAAGPVSREADAPVIGWDTGSLTTTAAPEVATAGDALAALLDRRTDVVVDVTGDPTRVPDALLDHGRVTWRSEHQLADEVVGRWALQLWTPHPRQVDIEGDRWPLVRAGRQRVPTLVTASAAMTIGGIDPELVVAEGDPPERWAAVIESLLDEPARRHHLGDEAQARTVAEHGPATGFRVVGRVVGWAVELAHDPHDTAEPASGDPVGTS